MQHFALDDSANPQHIRGRITHIQDIDQRSGQESEEDLISCGMRIIELMILMKARP